VGLVVRGVLVLIVVAALTFWWVRAHRTGTHFHALFTSAVGVYTGSDVRVLGVPAGAVDSVTPHGTYVDLAMHLDPGVAVAATSGAVIISPNLVSDRYVQLIDTSATGPKLADGATIGLAHTRPTVELDALYRSLLTLSNALGPNGANANGALSRLLDTGAANLKGNGADLNHTVNALSQLSSTLAGSRTDIATTLDKLASFSGMLRDNDTALRTVNQQLQSVTQTLADDRQSMAAALNSLGTALSLVQHFVATNRDALASNVATLSRVAHTLATQRASLLQALSAAPLLVQNFLNAYDPKHNVLRGRADLNELTVWASTANSDSTSAPPTMLRSSNITLVGNGR
jgi:virulence factor Mce-like protein